jgi:agmatine deiminase
MLPRAYSQPEYHMPAEYMHQSSACVGYQSYFEKEFLKICKALSPKVKVKIIASSTDSKSDVFRLLNMQKIDTSNFEFYTFRHNRIWIRDHGATFIKRHDSLFVADFNWNMYGVKYWYQNKYGKESEAALMRYKQYKVSEIGSIDVQMGQKFNAKSVSTDVVMEGGSIEVNGKGTLILCEEMTMQRNPNLSKKYIENELNKVLGTHQVIWMEQGLVEDPHWFQNIYQDYFGFGTLGHTDEFVRFVNDTTLLLAWVDESEKDSDYFTQENYRRMNRNLEIIKQYKDYKGRNFEVIKVPIPNVITAKAVVSNYTSYDVDSCFQKMNIEDFPEIGMKNMGDTINWVAASSYLNYFVTNDIVLLPDYSMYENNVKKQEEVFEIFSKIFPDREIVFIDVMKLNFFGGGIHCVTQQVPE